MKLSQVKKPTDTIFLAEVDGAKSATVGKAQSNVTGKYATGARHDKRMNFAMCDGSSRSARTNEFFTGENGNSSVWEWDPRNGRTMYWYPYGDPDIDF